jgi:N-acetylneuraminic acid mutarotase
MIIFGGQANLLKFRKTLEDVWEFDLDLHEWREIETIGTRPIGRHSHSSCSLHNKLMVIFGGTTNDKKSLSFLNDCWILDTDTYIWHELFLWGSSIEPKIGTIMENIGNGFIMLYGGKKDKI